MEFTDERQEEQGEEKVLYKRKAHFKCRTLDIVLSIIVFAVLLFSAIFTGLKIIYIFLIVPVIYLIFRLWFRHMYIITNKRFIYVRSKDDIDVVPIEAIEDMEIQGEGGKNSSNADIILLTEKEYGNRLLIDENRELGVIDLEFVSKPNIFNEVLNKAKVESGSFVVSNE